MGTIKLAASICRIDALRREQDCLLLFFVIAKFVGAFVSIFLAYYAPFGIKESPSVSITLATFGWALLAHELFFTLRGIIQANGAGLCKVKEWAQAQMDPMPGGTCVPEHRFALEGDKQLLTWLLTAAGIIVGLVGFAQSDTVLDIQKLGIGSLVVAIVSGIVYINVIAGAVTEETQFELKIEKFGHELGLVLLNVSYWSFALGVLSIFYSIVALPNPTGG